MTTFYIHETIAQLENLFWFILTVSNLYFLQNFTILKATRYTSLHENFSFFLWKQNLIPGLFLRQITNLWSCVNPTWKMLDILSNALRKVSMKFFSLKVFQDFIMSVWSDHTRFLSFTYIICSARFIFKIDWERNNTNSYFAKIILFCLKCCKILPAFCGLENLLYKKFPKIIQFWQPSNGKSSTNCIMPLGLFASFKGNSGYRRNEKFTPYLLSTSVIYLIAAHIRLLKKALQTNSSVTKHLKYGM